MRPFIVMTGMHRSGTSFLCRAFNLAGVYIGSLNDLITHDWKPHPSNKRGHWENQKILTLANECLRINGGEWYDPPEEVSCPSELTSRIKAVVDDLRKQAILGAGFKETRILLMLDEWKSYLPKDFVLVGIFRHPLKVAESLKIRSDFSYSKSLKLWQIYNSNLLKHIETNGGFLINFDDSKDVLLSQISQIIKWLGLCPDIDLEKWYSKDLIKSGDSVNTDFPLSEEVRQLYHKLIERSKCNKPFTRFELKDQEKDQVIQRLLLEIQDQGEFFRGRMA